MVNYISGLVFVVLLLIGVVITGVIGQNNAVAAIAFGTAWLFLDVVVSSSIRLGGPVGEGGRLPPGQVPHHQGTGAVHDRPADRPDLDGRHPRAGGQHPQAAGHHPRQRPVTIDGVLFFRVSNAAEAIIMVQDYRYVDRRSTPRPRSATSSAR